METSLKIIARIHNDFPEKFGIPRQSGLVDGLNARIIFEPKYRSPEAIRGLESFSHIWLIWGFSKSEQDKWSPTVRPPRLGGNKRMGVFATRSPCRPNPIGLSSVRLERIKSDPSLGPVLYISGADLLHGSPIYDIKPYLAFTDSHENASGGFTENVDNTNLDVVIECEWNQLLSKEKQKTLIALLAQDPRPSYQNDPMRIYGMRFSGVEVKFRVSDKRVTVISIEKEVSDKAEQ